MDYSLEAKTMEEVPTINECLMYSLMKYPECPPNRNTKFIIDLILGISP